MTPAAVLDHAVHTAYSDPDTFASLLERLPVEPAALSEVARNVIVHYRASGYELPELTRDEVNARWIESALATDQRRHPFPLDEHREPLDRVQGCCRDHTLLCVAALRTSGIPARSRVGYAGYFIDGWHHDHIIIEAWLDGRWRRFDAELETAQGDVSDPTDIALGPPESPGFMTAAAVWSALRRREIDADTYGVGPKVPVLRGPRFIFDEVIYEVAHRFGDELLLWDIWGRIGEPGSAISEDDARWMDDVARFLLAADAGDLDAERQLLTQYRSDPGLRPGPAVMQASPFGADPISVTLRPSWSPVGPG